MVLQDPDLHCTSSGHKIYYQQHYHTHKNKSALKNGNILYIKCTHSIQNDSFDTKSTGELNFESVMLSTATLQKNMCGDLKKNPLYS